MSVKFPLIATSVNGVPIRFTEERWIHITLSHSDILSEGYSKLLKVVEDPDFILEGDGGELLAIKHRKRSWLVVVYKEVSKLDGFVITSYQTTDKSWLFKRKVIWNKES